MYSFSFISCGGSCSCFSHLIVTHQSCRLWLLGWEGMLHTLLRSKASSSWCSTGPKLIIVSYPVLSVHNFCTANHVYVSWFAQMFIQYCIYTISLTLWYICLLQGEISHRQHRQLTLCSSPATRCHSPSPPLLVGGQLFPSGHSHQDCICLKWEKIVADLPGSSLKQQKKNKWLDWNFMWT